MGEAATKVLRRRKTFSILNSLVKTPIVTFVLCDVEVVVDVAVARDCWG
jgi:hypothetical protein